MNPKKILITGSSGFIGRNLREGLNKDYLLYSPTHKKLDLLNQKDVYHYLDKNRFDEILHCATYDDTRTSNNDPTLVLSDNLHMFLNLARYNNLFGRMFYFGTGAEFDMEHYIPKMKEEYFDTHIPKHTGSFSKYIMAKYTQYLKNIYNLRLFGCFGKYEDWRIRFISNNICRAIFNQNLTVSQNAYFDYLYIDDLISVMKILINSKQLTYKHYNVCTGKSVDLLSIAKLILKISGKNLNIRIGKKGFKKEYSGNNNKLMNEFKNIKFTPMTKSLPILYNWYLKNKKSLNENEIIKYTNV